MNEESSANEFELDTDETADLDSAVEEALRAVESGAREPAETGDESAEGAQAVDAAEGGPAPGDGDDLAELRDRYVRLLADYDNFRKRTEREKLEARRYEGQEVLREMLAIVDNLERALESPGEAGDLKAGVRMILKQTVDLLRRSGVERVAAVGKPFDPNVHEAVSRHEDADVAEPEVSEELQAGYLLRDRLLRPAIVKVAMPVEAPQADRAESSQ